MAVSYLSQGTSAPLGFFADDDSVLLVDPRMERGAAPLGERMRELVKQHSPAAWVIRGSSADFAQILEEEALLPKLVQVPVFGLAGSHDETKRSPRLWQPDWSQEGAAPPENSLREAEMLGILERSGAIYGLKDFHYILPSRSHAREFVRLADALQDPLDTIRIVDWLLPYLRPDSWVIADTGTLLPLLFALQAEARARFDYSIELASLFEYPTDYTAMDELLAELRAQRPAHSLLVVSVSSSGNVASLFERLSGGEHDVVSLCQTGDSEVEAISRYEIDRWPADAAGRCEKCDELNELMIDPRTYQVLPLAGLDLVPFNRKGAAEQEEFWRLADRTDAVSLHYDQIVPAGPHPGRRHMSIYVDISALLSDDTFRQRLVRIMAEGERPDHVLIPDHNAASVLAGLVPLAFEGFAEARIHLVESLLEDSLIEELCGSERVLVLDDSTVTGNTLISLQRQVYNRVAERCKPPRVEAVVALSRPVSPEALKPVKRTFGVRGSGGQLGEGFRFVEQILLPPPDDCPWCEERSRLARLSRRVVGSPELLRDRVERLADVSGLRPPILPSSDERPEHVTYESFVGSLQPPAAFAAMASTAHGQRLALEEKRMGARVALIDVALVVDAFYDPILVAALLRVVPKRFLRHHSYDEAVNSHLAAVGTAFGDKCLVEIAWAALQDKIPREAIYAILAGLESPSELLDALRELLEVQDPKLAETVTPLRGERPTGAEHPSASAHK